MTFAPISLVSHYNEDNEVLAEPAGSIRVKAISYI